ncbi:restriction endonuclease [Streptomyces omiyaensis]|uniref:Restriction endonuclease n=1 Tax=Streptomyces omiyaensis TaxID=68247 RepID=A0ABW7C2E9_9ACTN
MAAVGDEGRGAMRRGGRARPLRDLVLAVGLLGVLAGGAALMVRTARATGSYLPAVLSGLALLLGVGVLLSRRGRIPAVRGRTRVVSGAVDVYGSDGGTEATVPLPDVGGPGFATVPPAVEPPPAASPAVDSGALDHLAVDPDGFEHTVAALCARDGCSPVEVVGGAGDLGADVIATTPDGLRVVLQCKQYAADHRVGSPDLQRFGGTCYAVHEADVAVVVTTSSFTDPALEYAASCGIVCVDGAELEAWTGSAAPAPWAARAEDATRGLRSGTSCET